MIFLFTKSIRESTQNRTESLSYWVDATLLATQSSYRHTSENGFGYHQVVCPFVQRLGVDIGTVINISGIRLNPEFPINLEYTVVGDATTKSGLAAPYDEEGTEEIFKIEFIEGKQELINSWFDNENTDQYDKKNVLRTEFI